MRLVVIGPTGRTGEQIVRQGLAGGHEIIAVARRPDALPVSGARLRVLSGDVTDPATLRGFRDADAVLSALGSRTYRRPTTVYSAGTEAVLAAMRDVGVRRFVGITAAPLAERRGSGLLSGYVVHPVLHQFFGGEYDDMRRMEEVLADSDRDWTVFRPPRLTDRTATGRYRISVDRPLRRAWSLARADLAAAMLAAVENGAHGGGRTVAIAD